MAEIRLNVNITEDKSIDEEFEAFLTEVQTAVNRTLTKAGSLMYETLKKRIDIDVYDAFQPNTYLRRSDNPSFGVPLNDVSANRVPIYNPVTRQGDRFGGRIGLDYKPNGANSATTADLDPYNAYYDADNPRQLLKPEYPHTMDGNDLIRRIETGQGYTWRRRPGKREFWKNFVDEMVDDGELEREVIWSMREFGFEIEMDSGVEREAGDGEY